MVRSADSVVVCVLGVGEAGTLLANDLVDAGATVQLFDPAYSPAELLRRVPGATAHPSEAAAATGAALVLSVNSADAAEQALRSGLGGVEEDALWLDLNTGSPGLKEHLAAVAEEHGTALLDVALMAPVPGKGIRTPILVSGPRAADAAERLNALGGNATVMDGPVGSAAQRKLLRSVFFKGLAAAVWEALDAAEKAGAAEWLRENITEQLTANDASVVDRLVTGTRIHAVRREHEMRAAASMLEELGVVPHVARASADLLRDVAHRAGVRS